MIKARDDRNALSILLARAYVRDGKLRNASEALEEGLLPRSSLRELVNDPDFAPLVEHPKYGKPFSDD